MDHQGGFVIEVDLNAQKTRNFSIGECEFDLHDTNKIYWIHVDLSSPSESKILFQKLELHDEVVELCSENELRAKLLDLGSSLSILIQSPLSDIIDTAGEVPLNNLIIHLSDRYCLTASKKPNVAVNNLLQNYLKAIPYAKTPCFVLFLILDESINTYSDLFYNFEVLAEQVDLEIKNTPYADVVEIKRQLMKIKRYAASIRDILMRISGRKIGVISDSCRLSLQKLLSHAEMLVNEADSIRDFFQSLLDQIDNALIQQVNLTMKVLTGFAAIFLPLTLITGIYGMNFHWIPELDWKYGYFWALGLMATTAAALFILFKKKKWF